VQGMNGSIKLESIPGRGSKFIILFTNLDFSKTIKIVPSQMEGNYNFALQKSQILVVDDVKSNIKAIISLLDNPDLTILEAENGEIALEILNHHTPDLILMDIRMPGMTGFEVSQKIRNISRFKNTPIIAVTASVFDYKKIDNSNLFSGAIYKPVNKLSLMTELKKYLPYTVLPDKIIDTKGELSFEWTPEECEKLPKLIEMLKGKHYEDWKAINDKLVIFKIDEFLTNITNTALELKTNILKEYINEIRLSIEFLDLKTLKELIHGYPDFVDKLCDLNNKNITSP
jgi:CheY-like chemotaxis protein